VKPNFTEENSVKSKLTDGKIVKPNYADGAGGAKTVKRPAAGVKRQGARLKHRFTGQGLLFLGPQPPHETRAERILRLRKEWVIHQEELAKKTGISSGLLSETERGISPNQDSVPDTELALDRELRTKAVYWLRRIADLIEESA